jgi:hypothetical protein
MASWSGLGVRKALRNRGYGYIANVINGLGVPRGETNDERAQREYEKIPFATAEELALLAELRANPRIPGGDQTFGQVYNSGGLGETLLGNGSFKNPALREINRLSKLRGARPTRSGGRKVTRRRRHRVRQTRRK